MLLGLAFLAVNLFGCSSLEVRSPINFSNQPARALIRSSCHGHTTVVQGLFACEEKGLVKAQAAVKVPPYQGRVIYSDGVTKKTSDFNWYPETGFFIWKTRQISDTWLDMDLKDLTKSYGDKPVALDIEARTDAGIIVNRGILYERVCDDAGLPCSTLQLGLECGLELKTVGPGEIGTCERMAGSKQTITVVLPREARAGSKLYVAASRMGIQNAVTVTAADVQTGKVTTELANVPEGPTLVKLELAHLEGASLKRSLGHVLLHGFDPNWTGLDTPHALQKGNMLTFARPVASDLLEVVRLSGAAVLERKFSMTESKLDAAPPKDKNVLCAFAWSRASSDVTSLCFDSTLNEVPVP